jgi:hypothetical protein
MKEFKQIDKKEKWHEFFNYKKMDPYFYLNYIHYLFNDYYLGILFYSFFFLIFIKDFLLVIQLFVC